MHLRCIIKYEFIQHFILPYVAILRLKEKLIFSLGSLKNTMSRKDLPLSRCTIVVSFGF